MARKCFVLHTIYLIFPNFYQHVTCAKRGNNTLDHVYSNIKHAYRAITLPHLGQSDHISPCCCFLLMSPSADQQSQIPKSSKLGQSALCLSCSTASSTLSGIFSTKETWRNRHRLCFVVLRLCCADNVTVEKQIWFFLARNPECQRRSRCF